MMVDQPAAKATEDLETWRERVDTGDFSFGDIVRFKYWQEYGTDQNLKAIGEALYGTALSAFKKRKESDEVPGELDVSIFPAGCGVYVTPDGKFWFSIMERAIRFDWSAGQLIVDQIAKRSHELWPGELSALPEVPDPNHKGFNAWRDQRRQGKTLKRVKADIAEREPHTHRAYELCTSIFSAVNLERMNRAEQEDENRKISQEASDAFLKRVALIRPGIEEAEADFDRAAQRYARGQYGRGMLAGAAAIVGLCVGLAGAFAIWDVPAWQGVAVLGGGVGAIVSVLQRMASGKLKLDYDAGRWTLEVLGAVRPLIGAVFAVVLFCAIEGGWLPAIQVETDHELAFYAVLGFLAGFNERFAQDMLVASAAQLTGRLASVTPDPRTEPPPSHEIPLRDA
jgi:hypothetical protein